MAALTRILSIDGGGIGGVIPGQILVTLENKLKKVASDPLAEPEEASGRLRAESQIEPWFASREPAACIRPVGSAASAGHGPEMLKSIAELAY